MPPIPAAVLIVFFYLGIVQGLAWLVAAVHQRWQPASDSMSCGPGEYRLLSLALIGLNAWLIYVLSLSNLFHVVPILAALAGWGLALRPGKSWLDDSSSLNFHGALAHLLVILGVVALWSSLAHLSGGGWSSDWLEHYERARFFLFHGPPETRFLDGLYSLGARPPANNLVCTFFLYWIGFPFWKFLLVMALLSTEVFWGVFALLRPRRKSTAFHLYLAATLLLLSPVFLQNATYPWTKSLTAAYILLAICWMYTYLTHRRPQALYLFSAFMAIGILAHYSAMVWFVAVLLLVPPFALAQAWYQRFSRPLLRQELKTELKTWLAGLLIGTGILSLWFLWAWAAIGPEAAFLSNTTVTDSHQLSVGKNLLKILLNMRDTLIPLWLRTVPEGHLPTQIGTPPLIAWRDYYFMTVQTSLLFFNGVCFPLLGLWLLVKCIIQRSLLPQDWAALGVLGIAWVLGIATHGGRDLGGLMHISLQPLAYVLIAWLSLHLSSTHSRAIWAFLGVGLLLNMTLGIGLHYYIQSFSALDLTTFLGLEHPDELLQTHGLSSGSMYNFVLQHRLGLTSPQMALGPPWHWSFTLYLLTLTALGTFSWRCSPWRARLFAASCPPASEPVR